MTTLINEFETKQSEEMRILTEVAAALSSSAELQQILNVILTGATASQGLGFNRAFLFLFNENANQLEGHMAVGPSSPEEAGHIWGSLDSNRVSLSQLLDFETESANLSSDRITGRISGMNFNLLQDSLISQVCQKGHWVNLESDHNIQLDDRTKEFLRALGTDDAALVPLVSKGKLQGLLAADNNITKAKISDDSVGLLQVLANQAALAIQRSKLLERERRRIKELKNINEKLAQSQDQIVKFEKMSVMGEMTAAIAYQLRNPLDIIDGFVNILLQLQNGNEYYEYLNIISQEVKRTESVLNQVLDFSRASQNDIESMDFSSLAERYYEKHINSVNKSKVDLDLSLTQEKLLVKINREQVYLALEQLLGLIIDDILPSGSITLRTEQDKSNARLLILMRCPQEHKERLNRSLKQIFSEQSTPQYLSLLVARETFKFHGGKLGAATGADNIPCLVADLPLLEKNSHLKLVLKRENG